MNSSSSYGEHMDLSNFQSARLIPVSGIKGDLEQERRTTSAFLAVMVAVPEFARALLKYLDAPAGALECFIEPEFEFEERKIRPDGLLVVKRGKTEWSALVEVKTSVNKLESDQINNYLDLCRMYEINALLTISNEVLTFTGEHPTASIDLKKIKKVNLVHFSWIRILTEALLQKEHRGVSDPDQAWILGELIRFLQHPASGAHEFNDMGDSWVAVREGVMNSTLTAGDKKIPPVIQNFESLMRFAAFRLSAKLGVHVKELAPKLAKEESVKYRQQSILQFVSTGQLVGSLVVPNTVSEMRVVADLRMNQIRCTVEVKAPSEGRSLTRVNWLLRQLRDAPEGLRIETRVKRGGAQAAIVALNSEAQAYPERLIPTDGREITGFTLTVMQKLGTKRGNGAGSFISTVVEAIELSYNSVLEKLSTWTAKAPKLPVEKLDSLNSVDSPFDSEGTDSIQLGSSEESLQVSGENGDGSFPGE